MSQNKIIRRMKPCALLAVVAALTVACASQAQFLNEKQGLAMQTALTRGQTDLSCQQLSPTLIFREVGWPSQQGTWVQGIYRAEYSISVEGCGKSHIYRMICPDGDIRCYEVGPSGLADQGLKY
jgi:hypothetical protein